MNSMALPIVAALIHPVYLIVAALIIIGVIPVTHVSVGLMLLTLGFIVIPKTKGWQRRLGE